MCACSLVCFRQAAVPRFFFRIVRLIIRIIRGVRIVRLLLFKTIADLIPVRKCKIQTVRPTRMSRDDDRAPFSGSQLLLQRRQRTERKLIVLGQSVEKAIASIHAEPDRIAGKQVGVIDQIDHMSPGMAGDQERLNPDIPDIENIAVFQQDFSIIDLNKRCASKKPD